MEIFVWLLDAIFGGDTPERPLSAVQVTARAVVVYLLGLVLVRIGKSRLLGQFTALDVILTVVLGSLLSRGITGSASLSETAVACAVLVAAHWLMTRAAYHSHAFGNLVKGHAKLLMENGHIRWEVMRASHISEQDLLEELRLNANVEDISRIERAYKERNGQISGVRRPPEARIAECGVENGVKTVRVEVRIQ